MDKIGKGVVLALAVAAVGFAILSRGDVLRTVAAQGPTDGPPNGVVRFVDIAEPAGVTAVDVWGGITKKKLILETKGNGVGFLDYDRDGWIDIYLSNGTRLEVFPKGQEPTNHLYHNNRDGTFTDVAYPAGFGEVSWLFTTFGAKFLDYDNDGWKDIFLANGQVFPQMDKYPTGITYAERHLLFHNLRDGRFEEVALRSGPDMAVRRVSRGLATADYDNDGDLEIMVSNMNDSPELLRRTRKNPNHSILIKTLGTKSNRDGIGTVITVVAGGLTQYDEVRSGGSYLSSSDLRVHVGLGTSTRIDRIELRWPSGRKDVVENPPVDCILVVKEAHGIVESKLFRRNKKVP